MKRAAWATLAAALAACTTPLQQGERVYREGDRLRALEIWRGIGEDASDYDRARSRIEVVEAEFD